ncbi:MAG: hypothetical protein D6732_27250 [Methanobacteriota archaeon]|nr:MAG: hypothetical protein D6732_27250 [Euryarchaeota archaeon]
MCTVLKKCNSVKETLFPKWIDSLGTKWKDARYGNVQELRKVRSAQGAQTPYAQMRDYAQVHNTAQMRRDKCADAQCAGAQ